MTQVFLQKETEENEVILLAVRLPVLCFLRYLLLNFLSS